MMLGAYLKRAGGMPLAWGSHDCCTFVADWAVAKGWPDPMAFIRGTYSSENAALRRIAEGGGLIALWTRGMREAGIVFTRDIQAGDVGVIAALEADGTREVAAIYTGVRWAALGHRGLVCEPARPLKAWRI